MLQLNSYSEVLLAKDTREVKSEVSFTHEQQDGIMALLEQKWEEEAQLHEMPQPVIQVPDIQSQEWGEELSGDQALLLVQVGLNVGGWWIRHLPSTEHLQTQGYQYTDANTASRSSRGRYTLANF
jgi:hypothetical protein